MTEEYLNNIARNIIAGFLLMLGITPSEGEEALEIRDYGPHRVYTLMSQVPPELAGTIVAGEVLSQLVAYVEHHNSDPTAIRFQPYSVETYVCPCGCGTFLYVSIYHDA